MTQPTQPHAVSPGASRPHTAQSGTHPGDRRFRLAALDLSSDGITRPELRNAAVPTRSNVGEV